MASQLMTLDIGAEGSQACSSPAASESMPADKRAKFKIHFDVANKSDDEVLGMLAWIQIFLCIDDLFSKTEQGVEV
jgi:hypothetical protein